MEQATGERAQGRRVLLQESERALPTFQRRYSFQHANKIIDNAWFSACILHNMLHKYKKLDEKSVGENSMGSSMEELASNVPLQPVAEVSAPPAEGVKAFRQKLGDHFTYASNNNEVLWFKKAEEA